MFRSSRELEYSGYSSEPVGTLFPYKLDALRIGFTQRCGLPEFSRILEKTHRNDLEEKIVTSVLWFAKATDIVRFNFKRESFDDMGKKLSRKRVQAELMSPYDRLVKLMISLETLLIFDSNEAIRSNLAERVALLVRRDYDTRRNIVEFIKHMYDYRCSVVHHGGEAIPENELTDLMMLTQETLARILKDKDKLNSVESLREWFQRAKLG